MWKFAASTASIVLLRYSRRKFSTKGALLSCRNILSVSFKSHLPLYSELCSQIKQNALEPVKSGPSNAFHNHNAAHLTSIFRLGGSLEQLLQVCRRTPPGGKGDDGKSANTLVITRKNWRVHLGGFGLFGLGMERHYWSYRRFFLEEIFRDGPDNTLLTYYPHLAQGLAGDFYHAIIELGYYFESGKQSKDLLATSLAWLAASYVELPTSSIAARKHHNSPTEALAQLAAASGLPCFDLNDGSSGYIAATEALASEHLNEVLAYDIENFLDTHDAEAALMAIVNAAFESYAAGLAAGITDFYLLHNLTGARAVWAILAGVTCWGSDEATLRVRKATLRALWRAVVFTHASRNRPKVNADPEDTLYPQECRPWSEITEWALASNNSHIAKVVMSCADFFDRTGHKRFWQIAHMTMDIREGGGRLVGVGVGSKMDVFLERLQHDQ